MFAWFRKWRQERAAQHILRNLSKSQGAQRGFMILRDGMMLCCYDIADDESWKHASALRKSVKHESDCSQSSES